VFGRNDLSVPFYGAKVFTTDLDTILHETPEIEGMFSSFQLSVRETEDLEKLLVIRLERAPEGVEGDAPRYQSASSGGADLGRLLYERLKEVNQDFREVSKLFRPEAIEVEVHDNGKGPFEARDRRVKEQYVT